MIIREYYTAITGWCGVCYSLLESKGLAAILEIKFWRAIISNSRMSRSPNAKPGILGILILGTFFFSFFHLKLSAQCEWRGEEKEEHGVDIWKKVGKKCVRFEMRSCATTIMHIWLCDRKKVNRIHKPTRQWVCRMLRKEKKKRTRKKKGRREESNLHA